MRVPPGGVETASVCAHAQRSAFVSKLSDRRDETPHFQSKCVGSLVEILGFVLDQMFHVPGNLHEGHRAERAGHACNVVREPFGGVQVALAEVPLQGLGRVLIQPEEVGQQTLQELVVSVVVA